MSTDIFIHQYNTYTVISTCAAAGKIAGSLAAGGKIAGSRTYVTIGETVQPPARNGGSVAIARLDPGSGAFPTMLWRLP